jgi:hypothetical protein
MGVLANLRAANVRRPFDAILWWELRRVPFNAVVLTVSALSFVVIEGIGAELVQPGPNLLDLDRGHAGCSHSADVDDLRVPLMWTDGNSADASGRNL